MAPSKITVDQAALLITTMGLQLHHPAPDGSDGFVATARGGSSGIQPVKSAARITLTYRYANGYELHGNDLAPTPYADAALDEIRGHFQWAVDHAPSGYTITWPTDSAHLILARSTAPAVPA